MKEKPEIKIDGLTIHIPMTFRRRGGRKYIIVYEQVNNGDHGRTYGKD